MRFRLTLPQNEAFFQRYAALVPTLTKLGYIAQVVSALTEVGILYALIRGAVADIAPAHIATGAGIAGAILGTAFIEIGLRMFLPFSARQILNQRFAGLDLVMSFAIFMACALLLSASGYLSFQGSKDTVEAITKPAKKGEVVTGLYDDLKAGERDAFSADSAAIAARYAAQITAANAAHQAAQSAAKTRLQAIEAKERNQGASYATQKANIRQEIADRDAAHAGAIAALHADQAAELRTRHAKMNSEIEKVNGRLDRAHATEERNYLAAQEKRERNVRAWGGSVAWFTVLCLAILILAVMLQEVHRHGAGIEQEVLPNEFFFREGAFAALLGAIGERVNVWAFSWIKRIEDGTPEPPAPGRPPVIYEYEQKAERRPIGFTTSPKREAENATHQGAGLVAYETRIGNGHKVKDCAHCGAKFMPNHKVQRYCCDACRISAWEVRNGRKPYMKKGGRP